MSTHPPVSVLSEVGRLRHVVVQPPGPALERMLPAHIDEGSADYLLFDDLVHVPQARAEHDRLREVLSAVARVSVLEDLVADALDSDRKIVVVTGGVLSGIGKGVTASSMGVLFRAMGYRVTALKIDPYLNVDAGTMSPFEHGEVFVLDDGGGERR